MLDYAEEMLEFLRMKAMLFLMAVLVAPVMADDESEMDDFIGGVYRGGGNVYRAGNVIMTSEGLIFKSGSRFIYQNGRMCQRVGSVYLTEDNSVVVKAGSSFVSNRGVIEKVGSSYIGRINTFSAGSTMIRQGEEISGFEK